MGEFETQLEFGFFFVFFCQQEFGICEYKKGYFHTYGLTSENFNASA